jgi:hypothetical protein
MSNPLVYHPPNKPIRLRNKTCIYCRTEFANGIRRTTEHVVARKSVPNGAFGCDWNLIANACAKCNGHKAELENDISAVTMQPDVVGRFAVDDPRLRDEAKRKGKGAVSQRTRKPVEQSGEEISISGPLTGDLSFTFNARSSPQVDPDRAFELAQYQVKGFFYFITYDRSLHRGHLWPGIFAPVSLVQKLDWGNVQMRGFQDLIGSWEYRVHAIGADEYFKVVIRRSPSERPLWAWALEWNCNYRVIGFFGDEDAAQSAFDTLPTLQNHIIKSEPDSYLTFRTEVGLPEAEDHLFVAPDHAGKDSSVAPAP